MEALFVSDSLKLVTTYRRHPPRLVRWGFHPSSFKSLFVGLDETGALCCLRFARGLNAAEMVQKCRGDWPTTEFVRDQDLTAKIIAQLGAGREPARVVMTGTPFQQAVWKQMLQIPKGKTRSYAEIAARIKNSKAVRAVGTACGANPVVLLVPCHRITGSNGSLGGFGGGLDMKKRLLKSEGVDWDEQLKASKIAAKAKRLFG